MSETRHSAVKVNSKEVSKKAPVSPEKLDPMTGKKKDSKSTLKCAKKSGNAKHQIAKRGGL